jgi:hypothetical protein
VAFNGRDLRSCQDVEEGSDHTGATGNNVPWNKCPGNNIFYCNDINLRSLVSIAMHLNQSTNNKVGQFFQGDNHYCYTGNKVIEADL